MKLPQGLSKSLSKELPVLIAGPTASGKSALAMEIVARDGGVIVNADAIQVYDNWRILTARPSAADEAALPHALYGHVAYDHAYSVGEWLRELRPMLSDGPRPVIVGGTGLYFSALTEGLAEIPPIPDAVRAEADTLREAEGHRAMLADLDVTEQQWRVLRVLEESGPMEPTRISEEACLLLPSLTRILQKLEEKELIARRPDKSDRRRQIVTIQDKGSELIAGNLERSLGLLEDVRQRMGPDRYDALLDLLGELDRAEETPGK